MNEKTRSPLTQRQAAILQYIREYVRSAGYPPAIREIGEQFAIRSTNGVREHLHALERKGWLRRDPWVARGLRVVEEPAAS